MEEEGSEGWSKEYLYLPAFTHTPSCGTPANANVAIDEFHRQDRPSDRSTAQESATELRELGDAGLVRRLIGG